MPFNVTEITGDSEQVSAQNQAVRECKKVILLTEIGPEVYRILTNILAPLKARDISFEIIVAKLDTHFDPKPIEITESYKFGTRNQKSGKTVSEFIVMLKKLSIHCNFGTFLDRSLCNRFVGGLLDEQIQSKPTEHATDLTFDFACKTPLAMEMALKTAREFRPTQSSTASVNSQKAFPKQVRQGGEKAYTAKFGKQQHSCLL